MIKNGVDEAWELGSGNIVRSMIKKKKGKN